MRWFARAPADDAKATIYEWDQRVSSYWEHIESIRPQLPEGLSRLANPVGDLDLHGAVFDIVVVEPATRHVTLSVAAGAHVCGGRRLLTMTYVDADLGGCTLATLEAAVEALRPRRDGSAVELVPLVSILYDEIDMTEDELFEHRFLLDPFGDFTIRFADFELVESRIEGTAPPPRDARFHLIGSPMTVGAAEPADEGQAEVAGRPELVTGS